MSIKFFKGTCGSCVRKCSAIPVLCSEHEPAAPLEEITSQLERYIWLLKYLQMISVPGITQEEMPVSEPGT